MTVYVDQFGPEWGKWAGGAHMLASDIYELHAMAMLIGLRRDWFQDKMYAHYDLTASKRRLAIAAGAVPIANGETPGDVLMRLRGGGYETRDARRARAGQNHNTSPASS